MEKEKKNRKRSKKEKLNLMVELVSENKVANLKRKFGRGCLFGVIN